MIPKAAVFDMDGVLVDTEMRWDEFREKIWGSFGLADPRKVEEEIIGMNLRDTAAYIRKYNPALSDEAVYKAFSDVASVIYKERCELMPGVLPLLLEFQKKGIRLAIGSSSPLEWIEWAVRRFELQGYFSHLCSTESMGISGKPDPAVYIEAMRRLGVAPEECVIFEDSSHGLRAAVASGARAIAVPDPRWSRGDFTIADIVVESLEDRRLYEYLGFNRS